MTKDSESPFWVSGFVEHDQRHRPLCLLKHTYKVINNPPGILSAFPNKYIGKYISVFSLLLTLSSKLIFVSFSFCTAASALLNSTYHDT